MSTKERIIERIGARGLLLPELINRSLAAADRAKYYLALLQAAVLHAQSPHQPPSTLNDEREASGIDDETLDAVVGNSRQLSPDACLIPRANEIFDALSSDLRLMAEPLRIAAVADAELNERVDGYEHRVAEHLAQLPRNDDDHIPTRALDALTRRGSDGHDTVHQLITDLHWELNHLHVGVSVESLEGATAYGLTETDRQLLRAFMRGVNETAPLKFDHEGLGTTATRDRERLTIQNDLGSGDAHTIVVQVSGLTATLIYTDSHKARAAFLQRLLESRGVQWQPVPGNGDGAHEMYVGRCTTERQEELEQYLTFLGSRLVFLIDWNRARKRLARLVKQADATMLLKWAADNNVGHRAFLQAGDAHLIHTALERTAPRQMRVGVRLDQLLGRDSACAFLMTALAITSAGLTNHRSQRLIEDEIEAELITYLETVDQTVLTAVADHAALLSALSDRLRGAVIQLRGHDSIEDATRTADVAKQWEQRAEEIVRRSTRLLAHTNDGHDLRRLLTEAESVAEVLEQAAFTLTLVPAQTDHKGVALLDDLADLVNQGAREYVRCVEDAREIRRATTRVELERLLVAVDRLSELEHQSATAERALETSLLQRSNDFREVHVLSAMARSFQRAIESLSRCSMIVRDYVLSTTAGGR